MSVMDWPDVCPSSLTWRLESNTKTFRSPFNGASQSVRYPGSRWLCTVTLSNRTDQESRKIEALITALDGEYGRIRLRDWGRAGHKPSGSPVVSDADQTGTQLHTSGWTPGQVIMRAGDYLTVNDELKLVTADTTSSATGAAVIPIAPMLRSSPPPGAVIEVSAPWGIFKLKDSNQGAADRVPGGFTSYTLEFEEAF